MKTVFVLLALVTSATAAPAGVLNWLFKPSLEEEVLAACESTLIDRLRAPATYTRIDHTPIQTDVATFDECMGWFSQIEKKAARRLAASNESYKNTQEFLVERCKDDAGIIVSTALSYDAHNGFGTPVRSRALCQWKARGQDADPMLPYGSPSSSSIFVNGMNKFQWSLSQIRKYKK